MRRFITKMPPIFFAASLGVHRKMTPLREAYGRIQTDLDLPYIDFPVPPHRYKTAQYLIYQWMHVDGLIVCTRYQKDIECLRLWRGLRLTTFKGTRFVRLKVKDRLGLKQLKPNESLTFGPFFSTPKHMRKDWDEYLQHRLRMLKNPTYTLERVECQNIRHRIEYDTAYIIRRHL